MQFEHEIHEATFHKIEEYLGELFEEPYYDPEEGHFYVRYGTTVLEISIEAYGPEEAVVTIMSYCVQDVEVDEELLAGLLELNHQLAFGAFSMVGNDIFFSHTLFGRNLEPRDLLRAITSVATVADDYDDRIVAKYGGQTALERIQDTGGSRRRLAASDLGEN
ncbi:MAG TPA: YbjN domain-containing protein [Thermoanaerobaculia bacterium]|nr:YbjN domain-containing protein [Thermoanaerobaculia bacterium]